MSSTKLRDARFYVVTIGVLVASALFYLWQGFCIMNLKWEISALKSDHKSLARRGAELRQEWLELSSLSALEKCADELGLVRPNPHEMVSLSRNHSNCEAKRIASRER
jgi:hypothetical protein